MTLFGLYMPFYLADVSSYVFRIRPSSLIDPLWLMVDANCNGFLFRAILFVCCHYEKLFNSFSHPVVKCCCSIRNISKNCKLSIKDYGKQPNILTILLLSKQRIEIMRNEIHTHYNISNSFLTKIPSVKIIVKGLHWSVFETILVCFCVKKNKVRRLNL